MTKIPRVLTIVVATSLLGFLSVATARAQQQQTPPHKAVCVIQPTEGNTCKGVVRFEEGQDGKVKVTANISGLKPNQKHAIHIHQYGDITDPTGKSAGSHYNPENHPHGLPPSPNRHAGDFGNLQADAQGNANFELVVDNISIAGKNPILGRGMIVHALPDNGGQPTGNAGARIGMGVIGVAAD